MSVRVEPRLKVRMKLIWGSIYIYTYVCIQVHMKTRRR